MRQLIIHILGVCCFIYFNIAQGSSRFDIDKCSCGVNSIFKNSSGNHTCGCLPGYKPAYHSSWRVGLTLNCTDIDECEKEPSLCGANSVCNNTIGSYTCQCAQGYESANNTCWRPGLPRNCTDVDECSQDSMLCGPHANCTNTKGSFVCECFSGYRSMTGDSGKQGTAQLNCADVDECSQDPTLCGPHANCTNTKGSFVCECLSGYKSMTGDSGKQGIAHLNCTDIDECLHLVTCPDFSTCTNIPGAYYCACREGFASDSGKQRFTDRATQCNDVDECSQDPTLCGPHAKCTNIKGSFVCECLSGYKSMTGDSGKQGTAHLNCADINECLDSATCPVHSTCTNIQGGHYCACKDGFASSSGEQHFTDPATQCNDVDECSQDPTLCGPHANCTNTNGSFVCECFNGYTTITGASGKQGIAQLNCTDINECLHSATCPVHSTCTNIQGGHYCACKDGFASSSGEQHFTDPATQCNDINKCLLVATCPAFVICTNTPGSHYCTCKGGFASSSREQCFTDPAEQCNDVDKCSQDPSPCGNISLCTNKPGSYGCMCPPGNLPLSQLGIPFSCRDIDECSQCCSPCGSNSLCINTPGSFGCRCYLGYSSPNGTIFNPVNPHTSNGTGKLFSCQPRKVGGESLKSKCNTTSPQESSQICKFMNKITETLNSTQGDGNKTDLLKTISTSLYSDFTNFSKLSNQSKEEVAFAATTFLQVMEDVALVMALTSKNEMQNFTNNNITILTDNCAWKDSIKLETEENLVNFNCSAAFANIQGPKTIAFISYASLSSILGDKFLSGSNSTGDDARDHIKLNSKVVSVTTGKHSQLSEPFTFTLKHIEHKKSEANITCVYWKDDTWSTEGCSLHQSNNTHTTCACNHLSSFAILMALHELEDIYSLTLITYVGLTISLLCLLLTILTFLLCRSIHNVSTSIHLQLCFSLFLADLLFLMGMKGNNKPEVGCAVIAGFLHYLFLASFMWMLLEGLHLFLTVRNLQTVNYTSANRFKKRYMYLFGYGFPALIVAISAAVDHKGYGTSKHCWLTVDRHFIWSFVGPVCFIIMINLSFFITVLWILRGTLSSLNANVSTIKNTRLLTFKAIAQLFILGCSWVPGLLEIKGAGMVMAYLFIIINSLQGFFIFLVHCLLNQQVREQYKNWIRRARRSRTKFQISELTMSVAHTVTGVASDTAVSSTAVHNIGSVSWEKTS